LRGGWGEQGRDSAGYAAQPQLAGDGLPRVTGGEVGFGALPAFFDGVGVDQQAPSGAGEPDPAPVWFQQGDPELPAELADLL
jgi:hypothetical protein